MAPVTPTPAEATDTRRQQLMQKLLMQAQNHAQASGLMRALMSARAGAGATLGSAHAGARTPMIHGSSIANFAKAMLGVGGQFAPGLEHSNIDTHPQMPTPPPPPAGSDPVGGPGSTTPPPLGSTAPTSPPATAPIGAGAVDNNAPYTPTAQDNAIKGQTTTMWGNEAQLGSSSGLVPLGNGIFFDPTTGAITGGAAPTAGAGVAGALGHGRVV